MLDTLYPAGPSAVPASLTAPSAAYKRHTWLAVAGLLSFAAAYFALLGWFGWTAFRLFRTLLSGSGGDGLSNILVGTFAAFLAIFMAKGLVFFKRGKATDDLELRAADHPELFAFLYRLADEARAPRPKHVYLSPRVNAGVFYDLSLFNLILPSRKNLDIGLALMNVLNLGEFKAVLAHEFGHFAQRTMAVGRWVYIAHQIASQLVAKRDALDDLLRTVSRLDFRIAWIGWTLSLIVWAIRSLVELVFRVVVLSERALSREMEYQADLVAASLTGSDALVHALHRLGPADEAWSRTLGFASRELERGRAVSDLFAVQSRMLTHLRKVSLDPTYAELPPLPAQDRDKHRVFRSQVARPPQMWSTHPDNADRERNLKRHYVGAEIDQRPAILLLRDADQLKQRLTREMLRGEPPAFAEIADTLVRLDAEFDRRSLQQRYKGTYLGRSFVREVSDPAELFLPELDRLDDTQLRERVRGLYADRHGEALQQLRQLQDERNTLDATRKGHLRAADGQVHWRGQTLAARKLGGAVATLDAEIAPVLQSVRDHDRECRSLHLIAARRVGGGWEQLLQGQIELLHYAEHSEANLRDLHGVFLNTLHVVTADKSVSKDELRRLLSAGDRLHEAMGVVFDRAADVVVDESVASRMEQPFAAMLGKFGLLHASRDNINDWIARVGEWVNHTCASLGQLRSAALDALLANEDEVISLFESGQRPSAPSATKVPRPYPVLLIGSERKLQTRLGWWDRFQAADGWGATAARVAAAGAIIGGVLVFGAQTGSATVSLYNGLARTVQVEIDGQSIELDSQKTATLSVEAGRPHEVIARTLDGTVIEQFNTGDVDHAAHFVYNVAAAAPLVQWTAVYGSVQEVPPRNLGAERWIASPYDDVLTQPPASISSSKTANGGTRSVLSAPGELAPDEQLGMVPDSGEARELIRAHARWDDPRSPYLSTWLLLANDQPGGVAEIVAERLSRNPQDVATLRVEQEIAKGAQHDAVCARQTRMAASDATSSAYAYLAVRCLADGPAQDSAFVDGHSRWPADPWFAVAAGYVHAQQQQWTQAEQVWTVAFGAQETRDVIATELARVKRISGAPKQDIDAIAEHSAYVRRMRALGEDGAAGTPYEAYAQLGRGEPGVAVSMAKADPELYPRVLRLAAASDGAPAEMVQQALALPANEGIDPLTTFVAWATDVREGRPGTQWRKQAEAYDQEQVAHISAFVDAVQGGADIASAEAALGRAMPHFRGVAYMMATIMRGQRCPTEWREGAKKLLFAPERPYFN